MAVYDRWHRAPREGDEACRCSRGRARLYPSAAHLKGDRWQVRWYDDNGKQRKKNFALKEGRNPGLHADAFDAKITRDLHTGDYTDPAAADVTFEEYARQWVASRARDDVSIERLEANFRLHVYPVTGSRSLRELARKPSLTQAWIKTLGHLGRATARQIVTDVSGVYIAAIGDGLIGANPVQASSVTRPKLLPKKARAWPAERVEAMEEALPGRYKVIPKLGAGTGMRQGEIFGLGAGDITFLGRDPKIRVERQIKFVRGRMYFAPPKRYKTREVPLAPEVGNKLARHMELYPPVEVTLPWWHPQDRQRHLKPVTARLILSQARGGPVHRNAFNTNYWWPAQERAGITPPRMPGQKREPAWGEGMHALRHTFASIELGAGMDVVTVAAWMGDTPAVVLQVYAHFMPGGEASGRAAVSAFFGDAGALNVPHAGEVRALWLVNGTAV